MESGIDSRDLNFAHQVVGAGERVRLVSDAAVYRKCQVRGTEVSPRE